MPWLEGTGVEAVRSIGFRRALDQVLLHVCDWCCEKPRTCCTLFRCDRSGWLDRVGQRLAVCAGRIKAMLVVLAVEVQIGFCRVC
jgi:hypothetical protein